MNISHLLFSFTGRLNRAPYWRASIAMIVAGAVLVGIAITIAVAGRSTIAVAIGGLEVLLVTWISLALSIKRLHDRNKSAWWVLLFYFAPSILQSVGHGFGLAGVAILQVQPLLDRNFYFSPSSFGFLPLIGLGIGIWALVELGFLRGTIGRNSYGDDPLQIGWAA
jgi:uncharacterized membrane protein YhaH (DUF805 family)